MADAGQMTEFPPFRLDRDAERLWRGDEPVQLRPKTWELLRYMAARPGQLLSRDELLDAVWGGVAVTVASLNQAVLELRQALGDDAREPRFIETVHRRGFRFVAAVRPAGEDPAPGGTAAPTLVSVMEAPGSLHGRDEAIGHLEARLDAAKAGRRQVVFVTGDAGMGKTSLLRDFVWRHAEEELEGRLHFAWGQCGARQGEEGESFYPILDALDRLSRREESGPLLDVLRRFAPTWLVQLTGLLQPDEADELRRDLGPLSTTRMLRELCVATETLARQAPFVLVLEDLQWSDPATVEAIGMLAERAEPARLLVLATYRPVDAAMLEHPIAPLRRRLEQRGAAKDLALELLAEPAVEGYFRERFGWSEAPAGLATVIQAQTDGNPLFMVTLTEQLLSRQLLTRTEEGWRLEVSPESLVDDAPESLQELVGDLLRALDAEERETLEVASTVGEALTTQALAAGLGLEPERVEQTCSRLARGGRFIEERGVERWPDGTEGRRFAFKHTAFRRILYRRLPSARRRRLHVRVAERTEAAFERDPDAQAAYLATHYARGGDVARAVEQLARAAAGAKRRFAPREAAAHVRRAIELLATAAPAGLAAPDSLQFELGRSLATLALPGSDPEASSERCLELSRRLRRALSGMELGNTVGAAVDRLPDEQKEAVRLRYLAGLSPAEIARRTATTPGQVASRVLGALARLGGELGRPSESRT